VSERDPFDLAGVTIDGKYRVASVVGDGGFGVVYRGVHKGFGELIAIKCLKVPQDLDEAGRAELLEKLQDEGRLLHRLSKLSSGIVQALDVGAFTTPSERWVPYLVLEWLEGQTLGAVLKQREERGEGGMSVAEAVALLGPAARALAIAHQQKIAHRDVKPANLILTEVGGSRTLKVLDFGIAKVLSEHYGRTTALESTAQAPTAFTPRYGAPEQFNKKRGATGPWTDVFALALVFVECVTGKKALEGDDPTELYVASADPDFRPTLRSRGIEASDAVEDVLATALEVEPKKRYPDAGSFWAALEAAAGVEGYDTLPEPGEAGAPTGDSGATRLESGASRPAGTRVRSGSSGALLGPTMPAESMRRGRGAGAPAPKGAQHDPMSETPEGQRLDQRSSSPSGATPVRASSSPGAGALPAHLERRGSVLSWLGPLLALGLFIGGGAFAYETFFASEAKPPRGAGSASAAPAPKKPGPKPTASATAAPSASAAPAIVEQPDAGTSDTDAGAEPTGSSTPPSDDMVKIRAASFAMGTGSVDTRITRDFWLDRQEVTVARYRACVNAGRCTPAEKPTNPDEPDYAEVWGSRCNAKRGADEHPQNCVTAAQAEAYCAFVGARLPSEAEWELAARGSNGRRYAWGGGAPACDVACFDRNVGCREPGVEVQSCAAGSYAQDRTEELVYDLAGNVSEWTADGFGDISGGADPKRPHSGARVVRGASFFDGEAALSATHRFSVAAGAALVTVGFRCAAD
jgi:eukaryotic-like serine/threonine-protein kinase